MIGENTIMYDLRALQNKVAEILAAVAKVCDEHGLEYIIMHGTLLGAVRHKGFIPWDDDIDICMPRESYDKFMEIGPQYLPENLKIQHYSTEKECPNLFAKVRDCNTTFLHSEHVDLNINQGIFIDIFPIDKIKKGKWDIKAEYWRKRIFNVLNECHDLAYIKGIKRKSSIFIGYFVYYFFWKFLFRSIKRADFLKHEDNRRRKLHLNGDDCTFYSVDREITGKYSSFVQRKKYIFEKKEYWGPDNYDEVLSKLYGDYMTLPPKDKQITHKPLLVDLNHSYKETEGICKNENSDI